MFDGRTADRTTLGHLERTRALWAQLEDGTNHVRDHVAGAVHDHRIARANIFAEDVGFVVQRRPLDGHAADRHGRQDRERIELSRAADVDSDVEKFRASFLSAKLEGRRPAWIFARIA